MHHDDSIQTVSLAGRRVLVVRCDGAGRCDRGAATEAWRSADAELVWLTPDGTLPTASVVHGCDEEALSAGLAPVVDAVKAVGDDDTIVRTIDRTTLATVVPPALLPAAVVEEVLAAGGSDSLLADAARSATVVALTRED